MEGISIDFIKKKINEDLEKVIRTGFDKKSQPQQIRDFINSQLFKLIVANRGNENEGKRILFDLHMNGEIVTANPENMFTAILMCNEYVPYTELNENQVWHRLKNGCVLERVMGTWHMRPVIKNIQVELNFFPK